MFSGVVVEGHGRGRVLGFPTANIELNDAETAPPDGVYSCWLRLPPDSQVYGATMSVGDNPTFDDVNGKRVEAYIHGFAGDLYGRAIDVHLAARLRPMLRLDSVAELIAQTADDVWRSRAVLDRAEPPRFA